MPVTRHGTERPREPSLQLCIDFELRMCRIVGTLRSPAARWGGAVGEIPSYYFNKAEFYLIIEDFANEVV